MAKINDIRVLAEETASDVASSPRDWMAYLDTAAKLYRYPFADNLLIHAQRAQATACAELETWNEKMGRWVNRGANGIALIDDTGPRQRLRYVFDIEDTHMVRGGRTPYLWKMEERYEGGVLEHLTDAYGLAGHDITGLGDALLAVASEMTEENLEEAMDGLFYEVKDSFLEEMDADSIRVNFRNLMVDSLFYTLARRCGLEPMEYLEAEDFVGITDFNALPVLAFLGNAVCESAETVLRDIGRTVRKFYQEELSQQLAFSQNPVYNNNEKFNTLIRESERKENKKMELTYHRKGDYLFPNLTIEEETTTIGKYGMLRRTYLKEHKKNWYQSMLLTGKLNSHLMEIEKTAQERMEVLMENLLKTYPTPDKEMDQMRWAAHMNNLTAMAEENILKELVYS